MYLVTTDDIKDPDYFIIMVDKTTAQCQVRINKMKQAVKTAKKNYYPTKWERRSLEIDSARVENAKILTKKQAIELFGSEDDLRIAISYMD